VFICIFLCVETGHRKVSARWINGRWNQTFCSTWYWSWQHYMATRL